MASPAHTQASAIMLSYRDEPEALAVVLADNGGTPGVSHEYTYDANGSLLTDTRTWAGSGTVETRTYTYDANGNMLTMSDWMEE